MAHTGSATWLDAAAIALRKSIQNKSTFHQGQVGRERIAEVVFSVEGGPREKVVTGEGENIGATLVREFTRRTSAVVGNIERIAGASDAALYRWKQNGCNGVHLR